MCQDAQSLISRIERFRHHVKTFNEQRFLHRLFIGCHGQRPSFDGLSLPVPVYIAVFLWMVILVLRQCSSKVIPSDCITRPIRRMSKQAEKYISESRKRRPFH